jgi:hypothetical protein
MAQGFIQLHRNIQDEWFWQDSKLAHLMTTLILEANHKSKKKDFKGELRTIERGETIRRTRDLEDITGIPKSTISRMLKKLSKFGEIEIIKTKASHIKIIRYEQFITGDLDENWDKSGTGVVLNNNDNNIYTFVKYESAKNEFLSDNDVVDNMRSKYSLTLARIDQESTLMIKHYYKKGKQIEDFEDALDTWLLKGKVMFEDAKKREYEKEKALDAMMLK